MTVLFKIGKYEVDKKTLAIFSAILLVIIITIVYYLSISNKIEEKKVTVKGEKKILEVSDPDGVLSGATYSFAPFILNLKNGSGILSLKLSIIFFDFELPEGFNNIVPAFRNRIILESSKFTSNELLRLKNKDLLKENIIKSLNEILKNRNNADESEIVDIYFEEFNLRD